MESGFGFGAPGYNLVAPGHLRSDLLEGLSPKFHCKEAFVIRTLVVDDDERFRLRFIEFLLEQYPEMRIDEAGNGVEALAKIQASVPSLIFMDIRLPGANGLELTRSIKKDHPNTITVILTSFDLPEYRIYAIKCGANYFATKTMISGKEFAGIMESVFLDLGLNSQERDASRAMKGGGSLSCNDT